MTNQENIRFDPSKIRGIMAERGDTQKRLAEITSLSEQTIVKKLDGRIDFKAKEIVKIANHYKVSPVIFFV